MGTDPYLHALREAAESGAACPTVRLAMTGRDLIVGVPAPARAFAEQTDSNLYAEVVEALVADQRWRRRGRDAEAEAARLR
ncbi:MAG TPA: hypothetical protein VE570_05745 [Thermoleophilaceae bacterium]|nr:hypothetical protein [Thermoleophilaceae bacterium]